MMAQIFNMISHQNFMELILESWIFSYDTCVDKDNQNNFVNYKFTFQRFGKKYGRCGCKNQDNI